MVNDIETIKKVRLFGLNTYEAKIWSALLSKGISTAGELSDFANVPRSRSYDVLESLKKKGFVSAKPGKPMKYAAIPPKDVLENVKNKIKKDRDDRLHWISNQKFNNLITQFQETYEGSTNKNESTVAVLKGRKNIYKHLNFLFKNSRKEVISSIDAGQYAPEEAISGPRGKARASVKTRYFGARACLVDDDNTLIFPLPENEIHPDYDLCVWIKNKPTTKFLKEIICPA